VGPTALTYVNIRHRGAKGNAASNSRKEKQGNGGEQACCSARLTAKEACRWTLGPSSKAINRALRWQDEPERRFNRVQAMVDKSIAQRDVEYFNELLSKETDENRRTILLRLLADAEEILRQAEEQEERKN